MTQEIMQRNAPVQEAAMIPAGIDAAMENNIGDFGRYCYVFECGL